MISISDLLCAQKLTQSEIETGRCLVSMPLELRDIQSLTVDDLTDVLSKIDAWEFQSPTLIEVPKSNDGAMRVAYHVPAIDRLVIMAALVHNYDVLYQMVEPFNGGVNFDRPLPKTATENYMEANYRPAYEAFKKQLRADMRDELYLLHTDIRNFAPTMNPAHIINHMQEAEFTPISIAVIQNAFDCWANNDVEGVIQGYGFTDLLLKMALVPVDATMTNEHLNCGYYRYVDDIVITAATQDETVIALQTLSKSLNGQGLRLKKSATHLQHPNEAGHGHAYNIKRDMRRVAGDIAVGDILNGRVPDKMGDVDILRVAYNVFVKPSDRLIEKPKYLISHILREMRAARMPELVMDARELMDHYPQRAKKILMSAYECDARVMVGMSSYFFNDDNIDDPKWDSRRLDYLDIVQSIEYTIPPYDVAVIYRNIQDVAERQPLFGVYNDEISLEYQKMNAGLNTVGAPRPTI